MLTCSLHLSSDLLYYFIMCPLSYVALEPVFSPFVHHYILMAKDDAVTVKVTPMFTSDITVHINNEKVCAPTLALYSPSPSVILSSLLPTSLSRFSYLSLLAYPLLSVTLSLISYIISSLFPSLFTLTLSSRLPSLLSYRIDAYYIHSNM